MRRIMIFTVVLASLTTTGALASTSAEASAPTYYDAGNYQVTATHDGRARGSGLPAGLQRRWSRAFAGSVVNPIIAGGRVFVTVGREPEYGTTVYAFDGRTGRTLWSYDLGGSHSVSFIAAQNGRLFAVTFGGLLRAFDDATGQLLWSRELHNDNGLITSPLTVAGGLVYVNDAVSQSVTAVRQTTGTIKWANSAAGGLNSSPIAFGGDVYTGYVCRRAIKLEPLSGLPVWRRLGSCVAQGRTPVLKDDELWLRDQEPTDGVVISAKNGKVLRTFRSETPPALSGTTAVTLVAGRLAATDAKSGAVRWRTAAGGKLSTPPVISGRTVYVASLSGNVYGYDLATGKRVWQGEAGAPVHGPDERDSLYPGMNIGDGTLAVTATRRLTVFG